MHNHIPAIFLDLVRNHRYRIIISSVWIIGLLSGCLFTEYYTWKFISASIIAKSSFNIASGMLAILLTLLFGCLTCIFYQPLLYVFLFVKGFIYAVVSINISIAFGDAGWLMRFLLLFTDSALILIFLLFAYRSTGQEQRTIKRNTIFVLFVSFVIITIGLYIVTPFTHSLLNG